MIKLLVKRFVMALRATTVEEIAGTAVIWLAFAIHVAFAVFPRLKEIVIGQTATV